MNKADEKRKFYLDQRYSMSVLLSFLVDTQKSNRQLLTPFALIVSAAQYASGHTGMALAIPAFLGLAVSHRTMNQHMKPLIAQYETVMAESLQTRSHYLSVFDNLQKGQNIKFQFGGSCNSFLKATMRFFLDMFLVVRPPSTSLYPHHPDMSYVNQSVPSPFGMPAFETRSCPSLRCLLESVREESPPITNVVWRDTTVDPFCLSGLRVKAYQKLVETCYDIGQIH